MSICSVENCSGVVHAKGLCTSHYARLKRTGSTFETRRTGDKSRRKHPLYTRWFTILELARTEGVAVEWDYAKTPEAFDNFVRDVGVAPEKRCRLLKKDATLPMGPNNFRWSAPLVVREPSETEEEYRARRYKTYYAAKPDVFRMRNLRKYGITPEQYDDMHKAQNGQCPVCGATETAASRVGNVRRLVVEHDHRTKVVRSLACHRCNTLLGMATDDTRILEAAIAYLIKHKAEPGETRFVPPA